MKRIAMLVVDEADEVMESRDYRVERPFLNGSG